MRRNANLKKNSDMGYLRFIGTEFSSFSFGQWWAKLLRLLTVNSLSYFVRIKY
jgi:hypothetical protein